MERDEEGRRWAAAYLHVPTPDRPVPDATTLGCPDHPEARLIRLLGQAWTCPQCLRPCTATGLLTHGRRASLPDTAAGVCTACFTKPSSADRAASQRTSAACHTGGLRSGMFHQHEVMA